jgi:hypothetical protein
MLGEHLLSNDWFWSWKIGMETDLTLADYKLKWLSAVTRRIKLKRRG